MRESPGTVWGVNFVKSSFDQVSPAAKSWTPGARSPCSLLPQLNEMTAFGFGVRTIELIEA
jgi:hypothetical protein